MTRPPTPRRETAVPPDPMTLPALQEYVRRIVAERGFTADLNEIFILLVEEVGELATEFKHRAYYPERFSQRNCSHELADVLLYLLDLANGFNLDLMSVWHRHERANDERFAERRGGKPPQALLRDGMTLAELTAHAEAKRAERNFEDRDEMLMILLCEEVGEIATEIRKHWKGRADPERMGLEIVDALTYLLRLARGLAVDLEAAVREKEAENAGRVWTY
jgi:NTP pyrophosphatase (non-canonical NTP hydrolase)